MPKTKYTESDVRNVCRMLSMYATTKDIIKKYPYLTESWVNGLRQKKYWVKITDEYFVKIKAE
jgi:hypothetical protein